MGTERFELSSVVVTSLCKMLQPCHGHRDRPLSLYSQKCASVKGHWSVCTFLGLCHTHHGMQPTETTCLLSKDTPGKPGNLHMESNHVESKKAKTGRPHRPASDVSPYLLDAVYVLNLVVSSVSCRLKKRFIRYTYYQLTLIRI